MSRDSMLASDTVAQTWGRSVLGTGPSSIIIPLCVMASTVGTLNISIFRAPRLIFAAARDGNIPEAMSYLHVTKRIPVPAVSLMVGMGMVYTSVSSITDLIEMLGVTDWFFLFLTAVSLLVIRRRQSRQNITVPFQQPLALIVMFMLCTLFLVVMPFTEGVTMDVVYLVVFLVVGIVVFFLFRRLTDRMHCCDGVTTAMQLLMEVSPPAGFDPHSS